MASDGSEKNYLEALPAPKVYDKDNPPKTMSEAIRMAVADIEVIEGLQGFEFELSVFHEPKGSDICYVCAAGSVMARLNGYENEKLKTISFGFEWYAILQALSEIAFSLPQEAYKRWPQGFKSRPPIARFADPNRNLQGFKREVLAYADRLEAEGYC